MLSDNMDTISEKFYEYVSQEIVGSENVVNYRRKFFEVYDGIRNTICGKGVSEYVSSGSRAEGLELAGSDYDIMHIFLTHPVYENSMVNSRAYKSNANALVLETDHAQPGFTLLRVHELIGTNGISGILKTEYGSYLSNRDTKERSKSFYNRIGSPVTINGPCITDMYDTMDTAYTLRCESWPVIARHWLTRPRLDWPTNDMITKICEQGILLVPIGSKSHSNEDNPLEWRMSFSVAEKVLIHSFNHTQFLCYAMLKILTKDVIKKVDHVDKLICSYFLKTTIFWLSEENNADAWTPKTLLRCLELCLKRLLHLYSRGFIPNYFIPQHNMIDRKIQGQSRDILISVLIRLSNVGWKCLFECQTFEGFNYWNVTHISRGLEPEKAIFTVLPFIRDRYIICRQHGMDKKLHHAKEYFLASYTGSLNYSHSFKTRSICSTFLFNQAIEWHIITL